MSFEFLNLASRNNNTSNSLSTLEHDENHLKKFYSRSVVNERNQTLTLPLFTAEHLSLGICPGSAQSVGACTFAFPLCSPLKWLVVARPAAPLHHHLLSRKSFMAAP